MAELYEVTKYEYGWRVKKPSCIESWLYDTKDEANMQCMAANAIIRATMPLLGVMPRWLWLEKRRDELLEAIDRQLKSDWQVREEYISELCDIIKQIRDRGDVR